jgi:peptidyl-prolyl cis-trans isomerase-like 4
LQTVRIADDAALDDNEGMTEEEVEQLHRRKLGKAQATILEMVGDIADADAAPAENVLFVCKLNPVTTAEDLEIIFSRFGKIATCHIVTDWKTKESLQYGFVEFEKTESAEEAYVVPFCVFRSGRFLAQVRNRC